jgi:hypothetical protein
LDKVGNALSFDGVDDYVDVGNGASLQIGGVGKSFTLETWVKRISSGRQDYIVGQGIGSANNGLALRYNGNDTIMFAFWSNDLSTPLAYADVNEWHHLVAVYEGNTNIRKIYRDAVLVANGTASQDYLGSGNLLIGRTPWDSPYFNGLIDEVRIYNRALSATEIQTHYQSYQPASPAPIISVEGENTANGSVYLWDIPDDVSSTVKVRITDNNRPTVTDKSDNNFSITQPVVTLTSPNGGEVLVTGDTHNITWTTQGQVSNNLKLEYSKDNFLSDVHLIDNVLNLSGWPYYKLVTIDNSGNSNMLTNYQAKVTINNTDTSFWSHVKSDGSDIRVYDGGTELSYWLESFDYTGKAAVLWVKVPSVSALSSKTITLSYGNSTASGAANFSNTFTKDLEGTISTSGLVGNWLMNESSGTTTADSSGTGNTGTLYGPARPTGLSFDGVDDYVNCGNGASLNITDVITLEAWVKPTSLSETSAYIDKLGSGAGYFIAVGVSGQIYFYVADILGVTGSSLVSVENWQHIVATYDSLSPSDNWNVYVNGVLRSTQTHSGSIGTYSGSLRIGKSANYQFTGSIDAVRIYNRALTQGEITNNYNGQIVRDASLVMEQRMGEGSGTTLNDNSGNNNNGTINGATWVSSDRKLARGHIGNYLEFDGKNDYVDVSDSASLNTGANGTIAFWLLKKDANNAGYVQFHDKPLIYGSNNVTVCWQQPTSGFPSTDPNGYGYSGGGNITLNVWNHIGIVWSNGNQLQIYVNGVLKQNNTGLTFPTISVGDVEIGRYWNSNYLNGSIDDVKIYNRALSAQEISEQYEIGRGLVGSWNFDEGNSTTVADSSGQGNTGTLVNGPTWASADGGQWGSRSEVKFNTGSALSFDGVNDYVDCGNAASLNVKNAITVEAWVKNIYDAQVAQYIVSNDRDMSPPSGGFDLRVNTTHMLEAHVWKNSTQTLALVSGIGVPNGTWQHVAFTFNGTALILYQDGTQTAINTIPADTIQLPPYHLVIGAMAYQVPSYYRFNGAIDEVRIYNRALSAAEIQAHYQRRKYTSPEPANTLGVEKSILTPNSYPWVIPNDPSSTVKVRITDNTRPAVTDASDNNFQILGHASISLTSPNGNETLIMGDSHNVTWVSYGAGVSNDLKLEYSLNNGSTWALIADQQANDGNYSWTLPNIETTQGLVRITDNTDALVIDTSDAAFTITIPIISITSPNGAETWYATGSYNITWSSVGSVSNNLKLEYTTNGSTWTQISTTETNDGSYSWTVPDVAFSTCKVRITDNTRVAVTDSSNANFSILAPTVTVTSPNGAEQWVVGTSQNMTWTSVGTNNSIKNNLTLQYSKDNFASSSAIAAAETNDGVCAWTIPDDVSATVKVKIFDASRPATVDTSNANFSITQPYVRITAPNGGESWVIGTPHNITWTSLGSISNNLAIEYSKDNFATAITISTAEANDGTYAWTVPDDVSSTVKVRITDADRPAATDMSDGSFSIANSILTITWPNGAELFTDGDSENITWTSTGTVSNNLKLDYSKDNFATAGIPIATGLSNSGIYPWTVPSDISATVRVRITDNVRPAVTDKSNASFTILPIPQLTVASPNGGETWRVGSIYTVSWSDNGGVVSNNLTLQYSIDGGANWINISTGEANDGSYSWIIPDNVSANSKVRIYDASRPSNSDASDLAFSIALPLINITSPNGGETYAVADAPVITWTTDGAVSNNLTLEYTTDGTIFNLITSAQANTGSYTWTIPDFVSTSVKVRIIDGNRPAVSDLSNANFTVLQYPTVTVTAPNGSEVYTIGDAMPVTWTYKGMNINPLTISYSADNFATSSVITTGVTHSLGSYNWTIPNNALATNTLKVKVYDPVRTVISDTSDANFRIKGGFTITTPVANARFIAKKAETISWTTRGTVANVKLEYSIDNGTSWNTIISSVANTGTYNWSVVDNRTANYTVKVRVSDQTDSTIEATSGAFKIDYYTISWRVMDYDNSASLQLLSVKDSFWTDQTKTISSPVDHDYPYGAYTTFWTKEGYIDRSIDWTADGDKIIIVYLENQLTASVEWHVLISNAYNADTDTLKISTWLERRGKLVGATATDLADLSSATIEIYDGAALLKTITETAHDNQGVFWLNWSTTALEAGKTYFVKASITFRSATYTSGASVDVTSAKKMLDEKAQLQTIQTQVDTTRVAVDNGTAQIKTKLDDTKTSIETKVTDVKAETAKILTSTETTLPQKMDEVRTETEIIRKSEILNRDNTIRSGQSLTVRYRTYSGLSPTVDVYGADNVLRVNKGAMKEINLTGIYEYPVTFTSSWGRGDFTIVCSESTKGTMDALIITVLKTDVEEISGQVSAVLGTTSGLKDVKALADDLNSQFSIIEASLSRVGKDLAKEVKDAVSSVSSLESIYTQLGNVAKEIKEMSGEAGINLQKLYEISSDKKHDIDYLKNKTQQLKAAMALNQKTVDNIANKPVTQTWYEYK